ncbi:MAG: hypothetical protein ACR652_17810 [Methylocystis sp.]|uniref:hypothetical protein n=1 Tax=Methylocystis sp. TaxID=1911079 RepID=UPI003DA5B167
MSAADFFNSARAYKRELTGNPLDTLSQEDVDAINAATAARWQPAENENAAKAVGQPQAFFGAVRAFTGDLAQSQIDGFSALLTAIGAARWPCSWCAYGLATAYWETNKTLQPVKEAYWLSESWRKEHLHYYPWYGRGYVQLTWQRNYERADEELDLGGQLSLDPDFALKPDIAARILVAGMEQGWFTTKKLADYLPSDGAGGFDAFKGARRIINRQDRASEIAKIAVKFQDALAAGDWA